MENQKVMVAQKFPDKCCEAHLVESVGCRCPGRIFSKNCSYFSKMAHNFAHTTAIIPKFANAPLS